VNFLGEVERGKLKQADGVLQARRDRVLLPLARLERRRSHGRDVVAGLTSLATRSRITGLGSIPLGNAQRVPRRRITT